MGDETNIEYADHTWSPWRGCQKVSPGCKFCYAEAMSARNPAILGEWGPSGRRAFNASFRKPLGWERRARKTGVSPRVFTSMCDWLEARRDLLARRASFLALIADTPRVTWLLLTKRPERFWDAMEAIVGLGLASDDPTHARGAEVARAWLDGSPPANVWYGVSVENQEYADSRLPYLHITPAALRWVSYEPALGPVDFKVGYGSSRLDWVVVGGESHQRKADARPFDVNWARDTIAAFAGTGTAVFVKQLGGRPYEGRKSEPPFVGVYPVPMRLEHSKGGDPLEWPRDLDRREMPEPAAVVA